jgi:hypothetical protein
MMWLTQGGTELESSRISLHSGFDSAGTVDQYKIDIASFVHGSSAVSSYQQFLVSHWWHDILLDM